MDFGHLDGMPLVEDDFELDVDTVWPAYDMDMMEFDGTWDTDSRVCLQASAPRPAAVLGLVVQMETNE
jgi:hypothetical protein